MVESNTINTDFIAVSAAAEMESAGEFTPEKLLTTAPECAKTGLPELDIELNGGFMPGLIVLGGSPGLGKSTLALYIGEHIANGGTPVLYYSYEMPSVRIKSKLIACRNYEMHRAEVDEDDEEKVKEMFFQSKDLFNAETMGSWSREKWSLFEEACRAEQPRLQNLFIIDCNDRKKRFSARQIAEHVKSFKAKNPGSKSPVVIIDYLQILPQDTSSSSRSPSRSERQIVDDNLETLLSLIDEEKIPVVLISSLSRAYYKKFLQMDSFKDSGGIEYSADVLLGLQFSACHDDDFKPVEEKEWDPTAEERKNPREVELVILKNRYGSNGQIIQLHFRPQYDFFALRSDDTDEDEAEQSKSTKSQKSTGKGNAEHTGSGKKSNTQKKGKQADNSEESSSGSEVLGYMNIAKIANLLRKGELVPDRPAEIMVLPGNAEKRFQVGPIAPQNGISGISAICQITSGYCRKCDAGTLQSCVNCKKYEPRTGEESQENKPQSCVNWETCEPLTAFDCYVADAIYSIFHSGQDQFTLRRVLTALTGNSKETMTELKRVELDASIKKLTHTHITIDCTKEMNARRKNANNSEVKFSGPLLSVKEAGGIYHFPSDQPKDLKDIMPLYAYARMSKQFTAFPLSALCVTGAQNPGFNSTDTRKLSNSKEVIIIKHFLLYRLNVFQRKGTNSLYRKDLATISFDNGSELLKMLGLSSAGYKQDGKLNKAAWNKKRAQISKIVRIVLEHFKQAGHIADYQTAKVTKEGTPPSFIMVEKRTKAQAPQEKPSNSQKKPAASEKR